MEDEMQSRKTLTLLILLNLPLFLTSCLKGTTDTSSDLICYSCNLFDENSAEVGEEFFPIYPYEIPDFDHDENSAEVGEEFFPIYPYEIPDFDHDENSAEVGEEFFPIYPYDNPVFDLDETSTMSKDLELQGAKLQALRTMKVSEKLVTRYAFSEERALNVAKILSVLNSKEKQKGLTRAEADSFSMEVIGVEADTITSALIESSAGEDNKLEDLLEIAAEKNGVSPESMRQIINDFL
jgi:hypothetical protein